MPLLPYAQASQKGCHISTPLWTTAVVCWAVATAWCPTMMISYCDDVCVCACVCVCVRESVCVRERDFIRKNIVHTLLLWSCAVLESYKHVRWVMMWCPSVMMWYQLYPFDHMLSYWHFRWVMMWCPFVMMWYPFDHVLFHWHFRWVTMRPTEPCSHTECQAWYTIV